MLQFIDGLSLIIRMVSSSSKRYFLDGKITAKCEMFFLNTGKCFIVEILFENQKKTLCSSKNGPRKFKIALCLKDWNAFM